MRAHLAIALSLAPMVTACGDKAEEAYAFDEGTYEIDFDEADTTACGYEAVALRADAMEVGVTATLDGMRYTYPDATTDQDSVDCSMDGMDFDCDALTATQDITGNGFDAVITLSLAQSGTWTDPGAHDGRFIYTFTCEGGDCGDGGLDGSVYGPDATFPCDVSGSYTADKAG